MRQAKSGRVVASRRSSQSSSGTRLILRPPSRPRTARMVVCQFFQRGNCRFGSSCKNEHPGQTTLAKPAAAAAFSTDSIKQDLSLERPIWALSSYGPAKHEPNLIGGVDLSPEELRIEFCKARSANNAALYRQSRLARHSDKETRELTLV